MTKQWRKLYLPCGPQCQHVGTRLLTLSDNVHRQKLNLVQSRWGTIVQGVLLHLGYDGWWEQDMQEIHLKRMSDAKVRLQFLLCKKNSIDS